MKLALLLVAATALAAPASAQLPSCEFLKRLVKEAPSEFAVYRGALIPGSLYGYQSKLTLRGQTCMVINRPQEASLLCYSAQMPADIAAKGYDIDLPRLRACFPSFPEFPPVPPEKGDQLKSDRGVRLIQELNGHELTVGLLLAHDDTQTPAKYRVGFGIIWKKLTTGS